MLVKPSRTRRPSILATSIAALLLASSSARAATYTSPNAGNFTNSLLWDFGAGPVPASDSGLTLDFLTYGTGSVTAGNDLNVTLNTLNLDTFGTGGLTLSSVLGGNYAFTGVGKINLFGSGTATTTSAPIALGSTATGLTFDGAGASGVSVTGIISSNTSAGAPVTIATDAPNASTGIVTLNAANTFAGGVVLSTGTLQLSNLRALGDRTNTLTINGGWLRSGTTSIFANNVTLNSTLQFAGSSNMLLGGVLSGAGGVAMRPASATSLELRGANTYNGATTVGAPTFSHTGFNNGAILRIGGATGSILNTSSITARDGGIFELSTINGHSAANTRVSTGTTINVQSGFVQVIGNSGLITQNFGTVNAGGITTLLASTGASTTGTLVTIANLVRTGSGTVVFQGTNLGNAAVAAITAAGQGNIIATQINGASPGAALVGGGGAAGAKTISILPWALGDTANGGSQYNVGSGFVTHDTNGFRLLVPGTEYNQDNNFTTVGATENMRITGALINPAGDTTVNSLYIANTNTTINGAGTLTITSGALAGNTTGTLIDRPINFGSGGAGEAVVSVVGALASSNSITLTGGFTASSLTKSGHGILSLTTTNPTISGAININGGTLSVDQLSRLSGATALNFNSMVTGDQGSTLAVGSTNETLSIPITTNSGMARIIAGTSLQNITVNSSISGAGGMRFGPGSITLGGNNGYTGGTILASGYLRIDGDARLGSTADPLKSFLALGIPFSDYVQLSITGPWTSARAVSINAGGGVGLSTGANTATLSGPITGSGTLNKSGSGTLAIMSGIENDFAGTITLGNSFNEGGTLRFIGAGALGSASVRFGVDAGVAGTYALDLSGATDTDTTDGSSTPWRSLVALNTFTGFNQAHTVQLGASAGAPVNLRVSSGTFGGAAGTIAGFGKLVKVGTGMLTLDGATANTFSGGVEVRGGTLVFGADNQFGDSSNPIALRGGGLIATTSPTIARNITLGATPQPVAGTTLVNSFNSTGGTITLSGVISGAGGFNVAGGTLALTGAGANSYAGDTQVTAGALSLMADNQLGAASSRLRLSGGTLRYGGTSALTLPRSIIVTANSTLDTSNGAGGSVILSGAIVGARTFSLTKIGANAATISGDSPWFFGTLNIGNGTAATGNVTLTGQMRRALIAIADNSAVTFDMSGLTREFGSLNTSTGSIFALGADGKLAVGFSNAAMVWDGSFTGTGAASISKVGTAGLSITGNAHTFGGGFAVMSGGATLTGNAVLPAQSTLTIGAWGNSANAGPTLLLNNATTNVASRIADAQAIATNASEIQFTTNSAASSETIGALRGAGQTTVTMTTGGTLTFADASNGLTRVDRGTFLFRAGNANMGTGAATTAVANLTFGNNIAAQLIGGGGADGTTTISILPYVISGTSTSDVGSNFVTYGANGIRVLNTTTEVNPFLLSAGVTDNVRLAFTLLGASSLAADTTINALSIAGNASTTRVQSLSAEKLTLTSGALLNTVANVWSISATGTAGVVLGVQTAELRAGTSNTSELHVFTAADLALGAKVTTTGGLTKSGAGALFLTNTANSYTGATTINAGTLVIDDKAALGGSGPVVIGGGFLRYRGADTTLSTTVQTGGGGSAGFDVTSGVTLTLSAGSVSGSGGIMKTGTGVLKLTGTNLNTGATIIAGGALAIDGAAALGTNSRVVFSTGTSTSGGHTLRFDAPMTLTQDFITNTSDATIGFGFDTNGNDVTLSGTIASTVSTRGLFKIGSGNLTLTAAEMFTGPAHVMAGTLTLAGANGSIVPSTGTAGYFTAGSTLLLPGTSLVLDNTGANNNNRLPDVWDSPFGSGNGAAGGIYIANGEFKIRGNASVATSERTNQFILQLGTITLENNGQNVTLTTGQFVRQNPQTAGLIRGTNLGALPSATSTNLFVADLGSGGVQLAGAGGAEGTPFVSTLAGIVGDTSATGNGTELLTYASDTGMRLLTASEYTSKIPAGNFDVNRAPNVALSGAASVATQTSISALKLGPGASVNGGGALTLTASTVFATGNASINTPVLRAETNAGYAIVTAGAGTTLSVNSALNGAGFFKYGDGTLALTNAYYTGGASNIVVSQGTLLLSGANAALSPIGAVLFLPRGGTLDLGGMDRTIPSLLTLGFLGSAQGAGQIQSEGTIALGANRLTIYDLPSSAWPGAITGSGGLTKGLFSSGTSTFTVPLAYTGSTVIHAGSIVLRGSATLASTQIDVRGGTLAFNNSDDFAFAGGYVANRVPAGGAINLAGTISFTENANTTAAHTLGTLNLVGGGFLTVSQSSVTAPSTTTIANLNRAASKGTLTLSATNLGLAQSSTGNARIFATQIDSDVPTNALRGGGGAAGTTTVSIVPWAWSTAGTGSFVTYGGTASARSARRTNMARTSASRRRPRMCSSPSGKRSPGRRRRIHSSPAAQSALLPSVPISRSRAARSHLRTSRPPRSASASAIGCSREIPTRTNWSSTPPSPARCKCSTRSRAAAG